MVISWLQPEADDATNTDTDAKITASLTDPDGSRDGSLPVTNTEIDIEDIAWHVGSLQSRTASVP